jgi:hypothetical protein
MKVSETIEGYFHVPEIDKSHVCGRLDFDIRKGIKLRTLGGWKRYPHDISGEKRWDYIYGFSSKGSFLTLKDCQGFEGTARPGITRGRYDAGCMLEGKKYFDDSTPSINTIAFRLSHFDTWLNRSGVKYTVGEEGSFEAKHIHSGDLVLCHTNNLKLSVWHQTNTPFGEGYEALQNFSEKAYLNLVMSEPVNVDRAIELVHMFRDFFSLLMSEKVVVEDTRFYIEKAHKNDYSNGFNAYFPLGHGYPKGMSVSRHYMLFTYDDIIERIDDALKKWIDINVNLRHPIKYYHETYYSENRDGFQKLLDYTFCFEAIHRGLHPMIQIPTDEYTELSKLITGVVPSEHKEFIASILIHANQASLRKRLKDAFNKMQLSAVFEEKSIRVYIDRIVKARNNMVHQTEYNVVKGISSDTVWEYCNLVRMLIVGQLLSEVDLLGEDKIADLRKHTQFGFLFQHPIPV